MKRFLIPLLATLALPTAVNAESYWLIMSGHSLLKIEMESLAQCEKQGYIWASKVNENIPNPQSTQTTVWGRWKCMVGK